MSIETEYCYTEADMSNTLVQQKDAILRILNGGDAFGAKIALNVVEPFWRSVDYGYKVDEIRARIRVSEYSV
jgi:hypothetical protein